MKLSHSLSWLSSLMLPLVAVAAHAVSLSPTSLSLLPGDKAIIKVGSIRGTVTLANSNPTAVSATLASGTISVTANAVGVATLSVTDKRGTKTAKVTVNGPLGVSPSGASILVGQSAALTVSNAIGTITIANSNTNAVGTSAFGKCHHGDREECRKRRAHRARHAVDRQGAGDRHHVHAADRRRARFTPDACSPATASNVMGPTAAAASTGSREAAELLSELRKFASGEEDPGGIMAAHAVGYTDQQLQLIADFLSKQ